MNSIFKLLVFDWDGTLMDSAQRILNCMKSAASDMEAAPRTDDQFLNIIGLGLNEAIQALYPEEKESFVKGFARAYRRHFLELDPTLSNPFAGTREVLDRLGASGYLLAVATGKARIGLEKVLRSTEMGGLFHASRCADETSSKPDPQMLREIIAHLGVTAEQTLMIGDTEYDMQMSCNAGTHSLAVSYGVHDLSRLLRHRPLGHIDAINELPTWLEKNAL
ncbi:MAG: HAD-IA family hydrolase [Gammaproteobacteria bacterium]|nr:HAD-IA family hydrolase [Gammaproteobacteria bacterium]